MRTQQKIDELTKFAHELKENGFTVIVSKKHPFEWLNFFKDGKMGYVEKGHFSGFNFSRPHKPCREHGSALGTAQMADLTIRNAIDATNAKGWPNFRHEEVRLYTSPEEFINSTSNKWADYYIL